MLEYVAGTNKSGVEQGKTLFNDVYSLGKMDEHRMNYTGDKVAEQATGELNEAGDKYVAQLSWFPIAMAEAVNPDITLEIVDKAKGVVAWNKVYGNALQIRYIYDNVVIPQNDLPIINARMANVQLTAKARRIAIYYSQIAAFQAKTDYGFDLGDQLADQAIGELGYEIDSEIVAGLCAAAPFRKSLKWSRVQPVGVSKQEHYQGFAEIVEIAKSLVYKATQKLNINCA